MPRYWIGVASRDHVRKAVEGGFCQFSHGSDAAVRRVQPGDGIVYYSPREQMRGGEAVQAFTAIGMVAEAVSKLEHHPFPARLDGGIDHMLAYLASEVPVGQRLILANQWLFSPLIEHQLAQTKSSNASIRTTTAPTIFKAGAKDNVLPIDAVATVNFRLLPGDTVDGVVERVKEVIENDSITVSILGKGNDPVALSDPDSPVFQTIHRTIKSIFPDVVVAPYVMLGATDSKFYSGLTTATYRFSPIPLNDTETQSIHGTNERIRVKDYLTSIRFYVALIHNSQK